MLYSYFHSYLVCVMHIGLLGMLDDMVFVSNETLKLDKYLYVFTNNLCLCSYELMGFVAGEWVKLRTLQSKHRHRP